MTDKVFKCVAHKETLTYCSLCIDEFFIVKKQIQVDIKALKEIMLKNFKEGDIAWIYVKNHLGKYLDEEKKDE